MVCGIRVFAGADPVTVPFQTRRIRGHPPVKSLKEAKEYLVDLLLDAMKHNAPAMELHTVMSTACITVGWLYDVNPNVLALYAYEKAGYKFPNRGGSLG
jgi:hypothetical protein